MTAAVDFVLGKVASPSRLCYLFITPRDGHTPFPWSKERPETVSLDEIAPLPKAAAFLISKRYIKALAKASNSTDEYCKSGSIAVNYVL
jgi:hypothetical protein